MANKEIPSPPRSLGKKPSWLEDSKAKSEDELWNDEDALIGQKRKNDMLWLKAYGFVVLIFTIIFAVLFLGSLTSWSLHYILPNCWHWLDEAQLSKIQSVIFSGALGGMVSFVAQKQLRT